MIKRFFIGIAQFMIGAMLGFVGLSAVLYLAQVFGIDGEWPIFVVPVFFALLYAVFGDDG